MRLPALPTIIVALLLLLLAVCVAVMLGVEHFSFYTGVQALIGHGEPRTVAIIREIRLPRVLLGMLVGSALAVSGAGLQSLSGNPLADPFLTGVASGASVGVGMAILLGVSGFWLPALAFLGALVTIFVVLALARQGGQVHLSRFLLAGVVTGTFASSLMNLCLVSARQDQSRILQWLFGYLGDVDIYKVWFLAPIVIIGTLIFSLSGRGLDAMAFGDETARSVGVRVERFKFGVLVLSALLTASAVAFSGVIGFVGLIIPHIARRLIGPKNTPLMPLVALLGGLLLVIADTLVRVLKPGEELPVGVITSLLGAPFFLVLLRQR
jgi:iron complex transport system permease protein